eukprot:4462806-Pleurochrysis_carterae.AAC.4
MELVRSERLHVPVVTHELEEGVGGLPVPPRRDEHFCVAVGQRAQRRHKRRHSARRVESVRRNDERRR